MDVQPCMHRDFDRLNLGLQAAVRVLYEIDEYKYSCWARDEQLKQISFSSRTYVQIPTCLRSRGKPMFVEPVQPSSDTW
jgi:hypothetical protein